MQSKSYIHIIIVFAFLLGCKNNIPEKDYGIHQISIVDLKTNFKENPLGIENDAPQFSWILTSKERNKSQSAYHILIADSPDELENDIGNIWDSKKVPSNSSKHNYYAGNELQTDTKYYWKVKVWDEQDQASSWSTINHFQIGLPASEWKAKWIGYTTTDKNKKDTLNLPPTPYLRKTFRINQEIKEATLYITALGMFEASINGKRIGDDRFTPGWSNYDKVVYYKAYDVADQLVKGDNCLGAILGDGWYSGYVGPYSLGRPKNRELYGEKPGLMTQLNITLADGSQQIVVSDESWKANTGPIVYDDLLMGASYNANLEIADWNLASFNSSAWDNVELHPGTKGTLIPYPGQSVKAFAEVKTKKITETEKGVYIFDLGQNFAGHARLKISGNTNDTIVMRFGERLHDAGSLMTENLRFARATDTYILKGEGVEVWEPKFTYHGFRYVEVTGLKTKPETDMITGIPVSSIHDMGSTFSSSNPMLNRLFKNIQWTQFSNFMEIPTDSPQRDERLGWLGDVQIFSKTSLYNADVISFYKKWLSNVRNAQYPDGQYANFAPNPYKKLVWYSPGWMEAGVMVPYNVYRFYGDKEIIKEHYQSMTAFMDFHFNKVGDQYFYKENDWADVNPKGGFGDWLSLTDKHVSPDLMATMYFLNACSIMAEMSEAIGETDKAQRYRKALKTGKSNFIAHYLNKSEGKFVIDESKYKGGKGYFEGEKGFTGDTQSAYATALYFNMVEGEDKAIISKRLTECIEAAKLKPTSGILGIRQLLPGLSLAGRSDLAYKILLNETYPGWGFEIQQGATTIWERWNSYTPELGYNGPMNAKMNSFNHYAFGAVGQFLFNNLAGIDMGDYGFNTIIIRPELGDLSLNQVSASIRSVNGPISSSWDIDGSKFKLEVAIPVNTRAKIYVPCKKENTVSESGKTINSEQIKFVEQDGAYKVYEVGSGDYRFESEI